MPVKVPMLAEVGVPESAPVLAEKLAHEGMACIEKVRTLAAGSVALGLNE